VGLASVSSGQNLRQTDFGQIQNLADQGLVAGFNGTPPGHGAHARITHAGIKEGPLVRVVIDRDHLCPLPGICLTGLRAIWRTPSKKQILKLMGAAIGQVLPTAVGVALSPLPIVAVVLMLVSARGRASGPAFTVGWLVGLAIVGAIVLSIASAAGATDHGKPAAWVRALKLALGVLLLLLGLRQWQGRPQEGEEVPTPKWMGALETFTPLRPLAQAGCCRASTPKTYCL
jgi:hypothetical protein